MLHFLNFYVNIVSGGEIMDSISDRLKKALEIRDMTQADLVKKTGIGKSSISTYLSGSYEPKQKNTYKLAKALNVNEAWLMGYDVDIERKDNSVNLSNKELKLVQNYNLLNDVGKLEAQKRIEELTLIDMYSNKSNNNVDNITLVAARGDSNKAVDIKKSDVEDDMKNYIPPDDL
jgi:transcriptional regulator with XRE-family HTH domain